MSFVNGIHIDEIMFLYLKGSRTDPGLGDCIKIRAHFVGPYLVEQHTRKIPRSHGSPCLSLFSSIVYVICDLNQALNVIFIPFNIPGTVQIFP